MENNYEIHLTQWVPWHPYQLFLLLAVERGVSQLCQRCVYRGVKMRVFSIWLPTGTWVHVLQNGVTHPYQAHDRREPCALGGVKELVLVRSTSILPSLQLVVHCTPICLLPLGGQNSDAHFPLCGPAGLFVVSVCLFAAGLRTIPLRHIVVNTCARTVNYGPIPSVPRINRVSALLVGNRVVVWYESDVSSMTSAVVDSDSSDGVHNVMVID